jgi:L-ascorbate metabolism protein UlaG (beta-lactamase superfamily)
MMRLFSVLCLLALASFAQAQPAKTPKIIYHGHSFFEVHSTKGTVAVFDPHMIPAYPRLVNFKGEVIEVKADIAMFSHNHNDHNQLAALDKQHLKPDNILRGYKFVNNRPVWNDVNKEINDFKIRSVGVYHDTNEGMQYGINTIFIIEVDGWKIAHLGDLGHKLSKQQIKAIGEVDVLMIPVGGIYTLNGTDAKAVMKQLRPKEYVIPMHYGTIHFDELLSTEEFLDEQPMRQVVKMDDYELPLIRDPTGPRPLTVEMAYLPKVKKK